MSTSISRLSELPTKILEHVLLYLPGQDIIKMEEVNRCFQDLVRSLPTIRYRRELFSAGLADNPHSHHGLAERRKLYEEYVRKWSGVASVVKVARKLPRCPFSGWGDAMVLGKNLVALQSTDDHELAFLHIPPLITRRAVQGWRIPPFPFEIFGFTAYAPVNILAVAEKRGRFIYINLLDLRNGSPYCEPPFEVIMWELPSRASELESYEAFSITGSRIMMYISCRDPNLPGSNNRIWSISVWDRKTGDLVLDLSTGDDCGLTRQGSSDWELIFIDEYRLMGFNYNRLTEDPELVVFDTLIPQDHPSNTQRFRFPSWLHGRDACIHVDYDMHLGTPSMDDPLVADPAQAILVVELVGNPDPSVFVIVRTQTLIEYACSPRADFNVPWDVWGKGAVVMEIPNHGNSISTFVYGTKVVMQVSTDVQPRSNRIHTFDFSRRGCSSLQLLREEGGRTERKALLKDGWSFEFEGSGGMSSWNILEPLGDGSLFYLGLLDHTTSLDAVLCVWELV